MKKIRSAIINDKRHRIVWRKLGREKADGLAWPDICQIEIEERLTPIDAFDTLIHEYLHRALPDIEEDKVYKMANEITNMLDRADLIKR